MKYKVEETYTPDDIGLDRSRREAEFESESTDILELAILARMACYNTHVSGETEENIRRKMSYQCMADQLADYTTDNFEFVIFDSNGEWAFCVNKHGPKK